MTDTTTPTRYTVFYRFGGSDRFEWRKTMLIGTYAEMQAEAGKLARKGYRALIRDAAATASADTVDATAVAAAVEAANVANAGWTIDAKYGKWANAALAAYDAANAVYLEVYGEKLNVSANLASYKALDIIALAKK